MSKTKPKSMNEWAAHIAELTGEALCSKARAANNIDFVEARIDEGYSPDEVEALFVLLAKQLRRTDNMLPDAGLYSYSRMADQRPPIDVELPPLKT
jgi:hypothetical protein